MTLTEFLLARIAEDEAAARRALVDEHGNQVWQAQQWVELETDALTHVYRHDPHAVLAECEAKRRLIEAAEEWRWDRDLAGPDPHSDWVLELLALPYAGHPDYRDEWKP